MKYLLLIFYFFIAVVVQSNELTSSQISPTFSVKFPYPIMSQSFLPSLKAKIYQIQNNEKNTSQVTITHQQPNAFANMPSIERYWKQSRKQTKLIDRNEMNFGCARLTSRTYKCSRNVGQNGRFYSESLYWNAKNDLVLIRTSSLKSFSETRELINNISADQNSRIPAGSSK